eukprot:scpid42908/ scgid20503/ Chloride channel protein 2
MATEDPDEGGDQFHYQQTLMMGTYERNQLSSFGYNFGQKLKSERPELKHESSRRWSRDGCWRSVKHFVKDHIGEDWIFLLILGISMALLSFFVDYTIQQCLRVHFWLYSELTQLVGIQYIIWIIYPCILIMFSVGFTHIVSPHAVGSGIPEMKTVLRGVSLPNYLSLRTLVAKSVGLIASVGSGLPIGKEGPFVHLASILGHSMSKLLTNINSSYMNESRTSELLAAACAVGVSSNFAAPIGGVLFSIEVTSTYFAVRNYWRGFFAAVCSAFVFRLLAIWIDDEATITTLFTTHFRVDFSFDLQEMLAFAFIGVICGLGGGLFIWFHRRIVDLRRSYRHTDVGRILDYNRFVFPVLWTIVAMTFMFPGGLGKYQGGKNTYKDILSLFFSNITWVTAVNDPESFADHRDTADLIVESFGSTNIFVSLIIFIVFNFIMTAISVTLPIPAGIFFPVFIIGAAFGRLVGEAMAVWYPDGIIHLQILPGGYAVVGAAAMAGAVTHTISTSVIVFELTGQITHILPVMVAVLLANGIVQYLQPSIYDSIILIKKLPYLPDLKGNRPYNITAGDMMRTELYFISQRSTYAQLRRLLKKSTFRSYPLVDSQASMILLGSVQRSKLEQILHDHILDIHTERQQAIAGAAVHSNDGDDDSLSSLPGDIGNGYEEVENDTNTGVGAPKSHSAAVSGTPQRLKRSLVRTSTRLRSLFARTDTNFDSADGGISPALIEASLREDDAVLQEIVDLSGLQIDPAPFQLVESTNLYKVHTLFSLIGLTHSYVTKVGRLVGVVTLDELARSVISAHRSAPFQALSAAGTSSSSTSSIELQALTANAASTSASDR